MKIVTVLCNVVWLAFTLLVVGTEGLPKAGIYIGFTLLMLLVPAFTVYALAHPKASQQPAIGRAAAVANLVLLAAVVVALVAQPPHPPEEGYVPYVIVCLAVPALSAVALFLGFRSKSQ